MVLTTSANGPLTSAGDITGDLLAVGNLGRSRAGLVLKNRITTRVLLTTLLQGDSSRVFRDGLGGGEAGHEDGEDASVKFHF